MMRLAVWFGLSRCWRSVVTRSSRTRSTSFSGKAGWSATSERIDMVAEEFCFRERHPMVLPSTLEPVFREAPREWSSFAIASASRFWVPSSSMLDV